MKIALLGHSFVRDLESSTSVLEGYEFKYFWKPGSCFEYWCRKPHQLQDCIAFAPDIVYVILGSNSIVESIPLCVTKQNAKTLYNLLREELPGTSIIQCEIEDRFLSSSNHWGTPAHSEYHKLRRSLNKYLSSLKIIDSFCSIGGPGRLDNSNFYKRDKIHLNSAGLDCYWDCLRTHIEYFVSKSKHH